VSVMLGVRLQAVVIGWGTPHSEDLKETRGGRWGSDRHGSFYGP
jgi:hypothetical protein